MTFSNFMGIIVMHTLYYKYITLDPYFMLFYVAYCILPPYLVYDKV